MLSRTVTVGRKYALHIWVGFCLILSALLATFLILAFNGDSFTVVAWIIVGWSASGIVVSAYCLFQIQNKAEQIKDDLTRVLEIARRYR